MLTRSTAIALFAALIAAGCATEKQLREEEKNAKIRELTKEIIALTHGMNLSRRRVDTRTTLAKAEELLRLQPDNQAIAMLVEVLRDDFELRESDYLLKTTRNPPAPSSTAPSSAPSNNDSQAPKKLRSAP